MVLGMTDEGHDLAFVYERRAAARLAGLLGARDVRVVGASMPNLDGLHDSIAASDAAIVVVPERLERPRLADRWIFRTGLAHSIEPVSGDAQVVIVHPDGQLAAA